nr:uncharacterized protein LOC113737562 [Coffea arabica]
MGNKPRAFRFLNIWTTNPGLLNVVRQAWQEETPGAPLRALCSKLLRTRRAIQDWNKGVFGNVFENVRRAEEKVLAAENRTEGDASTEAQQRRAQGAIHRVKNENGAWVEDVEGDSRCGYGMALEACPTIEEVKRVVFEMDGDSAAGPDGFTELPRFVTSTSIVLIPKVPNPQDFSKFRPISLCNFFNKVLSRILADRLATILPKVISPQQTGFVKGRNITENYLLAQELLSGIRHKSRGGNVASLSMGIVWIFQIESGRPPGRSAIASVIVIGAEVLSRGLNSLTLQSGFLGFTVPRGCPTVTHLAFADDVLIFANGSARSLKDIVQVLEMYQRASGQLVNAQKSGYLVHPSVCLSRRRVIERITDVNQRILGRCIIPSQQESFLGVQSFCHLGGGSSLWVSFMRAKYCKGVHPCQVGWAQSASATWRRMLDVSRQMELSMLWLLNGGGCDFWYDNWVGSGGLFLRAPVVPAISFADVMTNGAWDRGRLLQILPSGSVDLVMKTPVPSGRGTDQVVWMPTKSGAFTLASAYQEVRQGRTSSLVLSRIWQARIPLKVSFFMLRLLMRRLPIDDVLGEMGFKLASKCFCCVDATGETLEHVFSTGQLALEVWSYFQSICGIASDSSSIRSHLFAWWMPLAPSGEQRFVCSVTQIFICWNIWKARCRVVFDGARVRAKEICGAVFQDVKAAFEIHFKVAVQGSNFQVFFTGVSQAPYLYEYRIVRWEAGGYGCTTLNTDGCAKGNPGVSGGGGVLRDSVAMY